jgi:hypothetical protein
MKIYQEKHHMVIFTRCHGIFHCQNGNRNTTTLKERKEKKEKKERKKNKKKKKKGIQEKYLLSFTISTTRRENANNVTLIHIHLIFATKVHLPSIPLDQHVRSAQGWSSSQQSWWFCDIVM